MNEGDVVYEVSLPDGSFTFLSSEEHAFWMRLDGLGLCLGDVQIRGPLKVKWGVLPKGPNP